jgi:hypothetical protein
VKCWRTFRPSRILYCRRTMLQRKTLQCISQRYILCYNFDTTSWQAFYVISFLSCVLHVAAVLSYVD